MDGANHPLVRAKLAVLNKKFKEAEGIYLEQGMVDLAMEMYQELHKWDDSLEIAARKVRKRCHVLLDSIFVVYCFLPLNCQYITSCF